MSARAAHDVPLPEPARGAAAQAAYLHLLGLLFERPRKGWEATVRILAAEQSDDRLRAAAERALAASEGEHLRIFGPGGTVSPREVAHRGLADPGRLFAELAIIYEAFAFHPRAEDPLDHVAVEVGFAGYLAMKEAYLLAMGDAEGSLRARNARELLVDTHLRPFAAGLRARLTDAAGAGHLETAATLLAEWAGCGPADLEASPAEDGAAGSVMDDTCGACPAGDNLLGAEPGIAGAARPLGG